MSDTRETLGGKRKADEEFLQSDGKRPGKGHCYSEGAHGTHGCLVPRGGSLSSADNRDVISEGKAGASSEPSHYELATRAVNIAILMYGASVV